MERKVTTSCYGKSRVWESRSDAIRFYNRCAAGSEGHEKERYEAILRKLRGGLDYCSDGCE